MLAFLRTFDKSSLTSDQKLRGREGAIFVSDSIGFSLKPMANLLCFGGRDFFDAVLYCGA